MVPVVIGDEQANNGARQMKYLIEVEGTIYGPFETERAAAEFALVHCSGRSWRLRSLHTLP